MTISDQELEVLLVALESDRVERKAALSDPEKIRQAISGAPHESTHHCVLQQ